MDLDRAKILDNLFQTRVLANDFPISKSRVLPTDVGLDKMAFLDLFHSQCVSRHLDLLARVLKEKKLGFYTIGSSGHEGNAAIAKAFRKDDMAFLHYRSAAFVIQRAKTFPDINIILDQVLSLIASKDCPISGGRHKVFGSVPLMIPPQTSTIASHLPKAVGTALSITLAKTIKHIQDDIKLPKDGVVLCSFGDASMNHSTAQGALNAALWIEQAKLPLPLVLICEDNGFGISAAIPSDWIANMISSRVGIHYISCDGLNLSDVYQAASQAQNIARKKGKVVFLHMKTVRLLGHAGSDIESTYRTLKEIETTESDDPLLHSARTIFEQQWLTLEQIVDMYNKARKAVHFASTQALTRPKLQSAKEIMSSIIPIAGRKAVPPIPHDSAREKIWGKEYARLSLSKTMGQCINLALNDLLLQYPNTLVFGEDVAKKGGVYHITADLQRHFGPSRVFDTLLDEQTILGTALGLSHNGFISIPEIQFLAYTHNAIDQIRGEAATLSFFSNGQYSNPMVVRIPSFAYQKGFGGHFHNENAIGFLREIPGLVIATPSCARDAALLLRQCVKLAYEQRRVVIFLEPIALYMVKESDAQCDAIHFSYPEPDEILPFQALGIEGEDNSDTVIISYANGMHLSRIAATILKNNYHIDVKLIDLRWLAPLNWQQLAIEINNKKNILIVDECRKTGSLSEELITWMVENCYPLPHIQRLTGEDCFIPLGTAWEMVLPSVDGIVNQILGFSNSKLK